MPEISENPMYQLLRSENVAEFNQRKQAGEICDFTDCDFRGLDLRELDADGIIFRNAYFRGTDLRGLDLRNCDLEGASLASANVSGVYFPDAIRAEEIQMSVTLGTRIRYKSQQ
jgi:uncharacterized protein YjbI with pentapeptide repeats